MRSFHIPIQKTSTDCNQKRPAHRNLITNLEGSGINLYIVIQTGIRFYIDQFRKNYRRISKDTPLGIKRKLTNEISIVKEGGKIYLLLINEEESTPST